ncbi:molybdenum cofactor guanylyltransferase MobA [Microvirga pudoricolor]|uniref:molybdenum cofactor guanylyltransferase MobA n=1 Tax=Microvirga pudoricolor TaxID=2778729 RepID=UPI001950BE92|nr:molybdenum cofactor guanylyltransferase MobA [Microvirga pudoricolor]MBM6592821.1 molybdenum cofactor guanylyltransferase MobA [Microvirga pudoricolor]
MGDAVPWTLGVVLAGGLSRRMGGGDKTLLPLAGKTLLAHVLERLGPQCADLAVNANGDPARFAGMDETILPDPVPGHPGPLAGILAALEWACDHPSRASWVVTVPGDTPFIPGDLVLRLHQGRVEAGRRVACASSGGRAHPAVGLWPVTLGHGLREGILAGERRVGEWARSQGLAEIPWPDAPIDPFFNINTPDDLRAAERSLAARECEPGSRS